MYKLTAIIHHGEAGEGGFWATCLEVPGANGQGETRDECLEDLSLAVRLILKPNREEALAARSRRGRDGTPGRMRNDGI